MAWTANRRLYWTADQSRVVEEGDPEAALLYRAKGQSISDNELAQYGIAREEGAVLHPASENKIARITAQDKDDLGATAGLGDDKRLLIRLAERGITRKSQVAAMTDDDLRAIDGVGPATLRKLREVAGYAQSGERQPSAGADSDPAE